MKRISPVIKNLTRKSGRTTALVLLTALLALTVFGGSIVILSLRGGLNSLENRLGADVIVVPSTARSKTNLEQILLQGTTGYFYMDREKLDKIIATDGVESASSESPLQARLAYRSSAYRTTSPGTRSRPCLG